MRHVRIVGLMLLALGVLAPTAGARATMEIAVQDEFVFQYGSPFEARVYSYVHQLQASSVRINAYWRATAGASATSERRPRRVVWDWRRLDRAVAAARKERLKPQLTLTGPAPDWASTDRANAKGEKKGVVNPSARYFGEFARAAAAHFKRRVTRYAIWNEPNEKGWLQPQRSAPAQYRALYLAAYKQIKAVDRRAAVLIGETAPMGSTHQIAPLTFLRGITCSNARFGAARRCPGLKADGFAHHPYTVSLPPAYKGATANDVTTGSLGRLTAALDVLARRGALTQVRGRRALDLYLTEYGYYTRGKRKASPAARARYLSLAVRLLSRNRRVRQLVLYQFLEARPDQAFDTSILDATGRPKPTFTALKTAIAREVRARRIVKPRR